jgi:two-component sensor histidine kinase
MANQSGRAPTLEYLQSPATAEADHRIANSLALIAGLVRVRASNGIGQNELVPFLREIAERIETVAKLHRHMARSRGEAVVLGDYLAETCEQLGGALAPSVSPPSVEVACPSDLIVPFRTALPLGLVTAELFSNTLKYAHPAGLPAKVLLSCERTSPGALLFVFEDDGVGFPDGFDIAQDGHLGMRFIHMLSEQLGGSPRWHSDPLGVRFEVTIELERASH